MKQELMVTATNCGGEEILHSNSSYVTQTGALTAPFVFAMMMGMKITMSVLLLWFAFTGTSFAFDVVTTEVARPYDVVPLVVDEYNQVVQMGVLDEFPVMYEFVIDTPTELSLQLRTLANQKPGAAFSLMVVRVNDDGSGVTEVTRQMAVDNEWKVRKDQTFGLTFLEGKVLKLEYQPGTYRVEVSTPVNEGKYLLAVGDTSDHLGYFETLSRVRAMQHHFGYSIIRMIGSSYVYYPLGILLLLFIFHRTWKFRDKISHA